MEQTKNQRKHSVVSYAMLGVQETFKKDIVQYGFDFIDTGVVVFDIKDKQKVKEASQFSFLELPIGYKFIFIGLFSYVAQRNHHQRIKRENRESS